MLLAIYIFFKGTWEIKGALLIGYLAQLAERLAYNEQVNGSIPLIPKHQTTGMVELVDTLGLGPRGE